MSEEQHKEKTVVARVDPELHQEARVKAVIEGVSLSEVIRGFLRQWINGDVEVKPENGKPEKS